MKAEDFSITGGLADEEAILELDDDKNDIVFKPYKNQHDYIADYLALLSLKLHKEVLLMRSLRGQERQESFLGLFISDEDIAAILAELHGCIIADFPEEEKLQSRITRLTATIQERVAITRTLLPHIQLQQLFNLQEYELDLFMLALAPELDSRFGKAYAFLHDDVSRKHMSFELAVKLIHSPAKILSQIRESLHNDSPLIKFCLIELLEDKSAPLISQGIKADRRLVDFMLGINQPDSEIINSLQVPWVANFQISNDEFTQSVEKGVKLWKERALPIHFINSRQTDLDLWLSLFCGKVQMGLITIDWVALNDNDIHKMRRVIVKTVREGHLTNCIVHIKNINYANHRMFSQLFSVLTPIVFISSESNFNVDYSSISLLSIEAPKLPYASRLSYWRSLSSRYGDISEQDLRHFASLYQLSAREISGLLDQVQINSSEKELTSALSNACRRQVGEKMADVAQRVATNFRFKDLILPNTAMQLLKDLIERQANAEQVLSAWRLGDMFHQSAGNSVLFVGPSGTGKTMAASVIANELGLDMYRIDLSGVVSKYIGETEKNLEKIFSVAEQSQVVLFIDEADALFGKRSEVKDAHDRYANIEVSYLLQKMEEHQGIVILASNLGQNIDDAFYRRFSDVLEFSLPKVDERQALWQKLTQADAPLSDDLDLMFLAKQFELSGGHIKNCILNAAFQAASENGEINMRMLINAIGREYTKLGRPISRTNFGDYYSALRRKQSGR